MTIHDHPVTIRDHLLRHDNPVVVERALAVLTFDWGAVEPDELDEPVVPEPPPRLSAADAEVLARGRQSSWGLHKRRGSVPRVRER